MIKKQRFIHALKGGIPDKIPLFDFLFSRKLYKEVLGIEIKTKGYDNLMALRLAQKLDHEGTINAEKIVTHVLPLEKFQQGLEISALGGGEESLKVVLVS